MTGIILSMDGSVWWNSSHESGPGDRRRMTGTKESSNFQKSVPSAPILLPKLYLLSGSTVPPDSRTNQGTTYKPVENSLDSNHK